MGKWTFENTVSRTVALLVLALLVLLLILKVAMGDEPKPPKHKRGRTMFVYLDKDEHGRIVLDPYLAPQLFFKVEPTVPGTVITPLRRGQALNCDYFTVVRAVGTDDDRELVYTINLKCHGEFGPRYVLDGIAFR